MLTSKQKPAPGFLSRLNWKTASYLLVFFIVMIVALSVIINRSHNPSTVSGSDDSGSEKQNQTLLSDNQKTNFHPPVKDNKDSIDLPMKPVQLTDVESVSMSEENRQYIASFNLWLEPDEVINTLANLLKDDDVTVRLQAVRELALIDNEEVIKILVNALDDDDSNVRAEIINALGQSKINTEPFIGQVIFNEEEPLLRLQAVRLLAARSNHAALSFVIAARNDRDERVREEARYWLDAMVWDIDIMVHEDAGTILSNDNSIEEKIVVIQEVITQFDQQRAVGILQKVLMQEDDAAVRLQTVMELSSIDDYQAEVALATALGDKDREVRYQAIEALGAYGSRAINTLAQAMFSDPDPELRRRAYELLIEQGDPAAQALILRAEQIGLENLPKSE